MKFSATPLIALIACCPFVLAQGTEQDNIENLNSGNVSGRVDAAFTHAAERMNGWIEARNELQAIPAEEVVPVIVQALQGSVAKRADLRELAYTVLAHHNSAKTKSGHDQLIVGLRDVAPSVQHICCNALGSEIVSIELEQYHARLVAKSTSSSERRRILRTISGWRSYASAALGSIQPIFADKDAGEGLRWFAAQAMLNIGGLEYALRHFRNLDPEAEKVIMWSLGKFVGQTDAKLHYNLTGTYRQARAKARKLVLKTLNSENKKSRLAAAEVLFSVFGMDFVIFHSSNNYEWNKEMRDALIALSHGPEPGLRKTASQLLAMDLDTLAERILRRKRRHERQRLVEERQQENVKSLP